MSKASTSYFPSLDAASNGLTERDYINLDRRWISSEIADVAGIRRVDSFTGASHMGRHDNGSYAGLLIPYFHPGQAPVREWRLRRDQPEIEYRDGQPKEVAKYLSPPGRGNMLYFPPDITKVILDDVSLPIVVTEGEFKTLALWRLANYESTRPRFLPIGLAGVWNFRGTIGKVDGPNGERLSEVGVIADLSAIAWAGREVIIAFDTDLKTNSKVKVARWVLSRELRVRGSVVGNLEWDAAVGKGVDDWLASAGPYAVLKAIADVDFNRTTGWRAKLLVSNQGKPKALLENASVALQYAPEWEGVLAFDDFRHRIVTLAPLPWDGFKAGDEWTETEDLATTRWLQQNGIEVGKDITAQAIQLTARTKRIHPVRTYLEGRRWDGQPRLDTWLADYCQVKQSVYTAAVGAKFLISAVARVFCPGAKVDHVLVLEGAQGIGKSSAGRILAGEFFTDQLPDLHSKDSQLQLAGIWICELSELSALSRSEKSQIKAFVTVQTDRYRPPYGRRPEEVPRQTVFLGTTNHDVYLEDETGNRRWWPVTCGGKIDLAALARDRDQLWAEASHRYQCGEKWWLDDSAQMRLAADEQQSRYQHDPWQPLVEQWIQNPVEKLDERGHPLAKMISTADFVTTSDILTHCIGKRTDLWNQTDKNRIHRCMTALNWRKRQKRVDGALERGFIKQSEDAV